MCDVHSLTPGITNAQNNTKQIILSLAKSKHTFQFSCSFIHAKLFSLCILTIIPGRGGGGGTSCSFISIHCCGLHIKEVQKKKIRQCSKQMWVIESDQLLITIHPAYISVWIRVLWLRFVRAICKCGACKSKPFVKGIIRFKGCF